ncbi:MAG: PAS domain-containing protein [Elusimicrobiales bacterium]
MSAKDNDGKPGMPDGQRNFVETLLATLPVPVFYKDVEGRYTGFNDAFLAFTGRTREELLGKTVFAAAAREIAQRYKDKDDELLVSGGVQIYEWKVKRPGGEVRDVVFHKALLYNGLGGKEGLVGVIMDITDLKLAERRLKDSEGKLLATLSSMDETVLVFDAAGRLQEFYGSSRPAAVFRDAAAGRHYSEIFPAPAALELRGAAARLKETLLPQDFDFKAEQGGGETWYSMRLSARKSAEGDYFGLTAVCRDISERKRMEAAEREVNDLRGLIPICASCKKIRDDKGYWQQVESYLSQHSPARFTHGLCKECETRLYGGQDWYKRGPEPDGKDGK